jgi:hypothetical protein
MTLQPVTKTIDENNESDACQDRSANHYSFELLHKCGLTPSSATAPETSGRLQQSLTNHLNCSTAQLGGGSLR